MPLYQEITCPFPTFQSPSQLPIGIYIHLCYNITCGGFHSIKANPFIYNNNNNGFYLTKIDTCVSTQDYLTWSSIILFPNNFNILMCQILPFAL